MSLKFAVGGATVGLASMAMALHYRDWFPETEKQIRRRIQRKYAKTIIPPTAEFIESQIQAELDFQSVRNDTPFTNVLYATSGVIGALCGVLTSAMVKRG